MKNTTKTITMSEQQQFDISRILEESYRNSERLMLKEIEKANNIVMNNLQNYTQYRFEDAVQMEQYQNTLYSVYRTQSENIQKLIKALHNKKEF